MRLICVTVFSDLLAGPLATYPSKELRIMDRLTISVEEAARALSISRAHAFRMAANGELPTVRLGKRLLVPIDALNKLAASAKVPAGAAH
jgi:excisionase family DNA binding protein